MLRLLICCLNRFAGYIVRIAFCVLVDIIYVLSPLFPINPAALCAGSNNSCGLTYRIGGMCRRCGGCLWDLTLYSSKQHSYCVRNHLHTHYNHHSHRICPYQSHSGNSPQRFLSLISLVFLLCNQLVSHYHSPLYGAGSGCQAIISATGRDKFFSGLIYA